MEPTCTLPAVTGPFVSGILGYVDCQAKTLGAVGFQTFAAPGSSIATLLGLLLTLFVALIGFRLVLAETPDLRQLLGWALRVGFVLMLATSWPAVRVLVFDVATKAPAQLAAEMTRPLQLAGFEGELGDQMQLVSDGIDRLIDPRLAASAPVAPTPATPMPADPNAGAAPAGPLPQITGPANPTLGFNLSTPLPAAKQVFLLFGLGVLTALHAATGLLLALTPLFACFLLFDGTRGLFEGWVRGLAGAALATLGATVVLGLEVTTLVPLLDQLAELAAVGQPLGPGASNLLLATLLFAAAMLGGLWAALRATGTFRIGWPTRLVLPETRVSATGNGVATAAAEAPGRGLVVASEHHRATAVTEALVAAERREARSNLVTSRQIQSVASDRPDAGGVVPLGQSFRRRAQLRQTSSGARRDLR